MAKDRTRHGRREVAERLRGVTEEELQYVFLKKILNSAVGGHCFDDEGDIDNGLILNRLADLIDPTCEMEAAGDVPALVKNNLETFFCSECGSPIYNDSNPSYCLYCGHRVVDRR